MSIEGFLFIFLLGLLCVFGVALKKSKVIVVTIFVFVWIWVAFSMDSSDINWYRYAYDKNIYLGKDRAFYELQNIFIKLGATFEVFKFCVCTFIVVIVFLALFKYTNYLAMLLGLCLFIPFGSFATQIRNGISGALVIYAITFLSPKKIVKTKEVIKFSFFIVLASVFHQSSLFYFVLLFSVIGKDKTSKFVKWCRNLAFILLFSMVILSPTIFKFAQELQNSVSSEYVRVLLFRISQMFSNEFASTLKGTIFNVCHHLTLYFCAEKTLVDIKRRVKCSENEERQLLVKQKINALILLLLPFYSISYHFIRVFYYLTPFLYSIVINNVFKIRKETGHIKYGQINLCLLYGCTIFVSLFNIFQEPQEFIKIIAGITLGW